MVNKENITMLTLGNVDKIRFVDAQSQVAQHASGQLWGQGYEVKVLTESKELDEDKTNEINKILKRAGFADIVLRNEFAMSAYGRQINTIDVDNGKNIWIGESDPLYYNQVGRVHFINEMSAVVWKKSSVR